MTGILLAALVLSYPPASSGQSESGAAPYDRSATRTLAKWRDEVRSALRNQASAKDLDQPAAVVRLLTLYQQLGADKQLQASQQKRLRAVICTRLVRICDDLAADIKHRLNRVASFTERARRQHRPDLLEKIQDDQAVLAQWNGALAQLGGGAAAPGAAAGNQADESQQLVDLIQSVVTPDAWDANGGAGKIVYFAPGHALVISATTETHENVSDLLNALRRAGN